VKKIREIKLDFVVDILSNSIQNAISGEVFDTIITKLDLGDSKQIKKTDWVFNWKGEYNDKSKQVFKLTTVNNPTIIQGLICLIDKGDHVFMELIESAKFNKGKNKLYHGVAGNLVAFACKMSFELNYEGVVSFIAKTQLVGHYEQTLGAKLFAGNRMFIDTREATVLVKKYFKDFEL
jgi:hypothetical protein